MSRAAIATAKAAAGAPDAVAAVRGLDAPRNDTDARASWRRAAEASETRESARDALNEDEDERGSDVEDERGSGAGRGGDVSSRDTPKPSRCPG